MIQDFPVLNINSMMKNQKGELFGFQVGDKILDLDLVDFRKCDVLFFITELHRTQIYQQSEASCQ